MEKSIKILLAIIALIVFITAIVLGIYFGIYYDDSDKTTHLSPTNSGSNSKSVVSGSKSTVISSKSTVIISKSNSTGVGSGSNSTDVGSGSNSTGVGSGSNSTGVGSTTSGSSSNSTGVGSTTSGSSNITNPVIPKPLICNIPKDTPPYTLGNRKSHYLDGHTVDCENKPLNRFQFGTLPGDNAKYTYTCCDNTGGSYQQTPIDKETQPNEDGGGNMDYLDKHNVDCGTDSVISKFALNRPSGNSIKYKYTCLKSVKPLTCRDITTPLNLKGDNATIEYLDRHNLSCNTDEAIGRFQYIRGDNGTKIAYSYRCCK
jgi:hypothetical protein